MTVKKPLLCVSHTVTGTATIRAVLSGVSRDITISEGVYWTDPTLSDVTIASDVNDLGAAVVYKMEAAQTAAGAAAINSTVIYTPITTTYSSGFYAPTMEPAITVATDPTNAATTTAGKSVIARLGGNLLASNTWDDASFDGTGGVLFGTWCPQRGESGDVDERDEGYGVAVRSHAGAAYSFNLGASQASRLVSLRSLRGDLVHARSEARLTFGTYSLKSHVWRYAQAGEKIRYYADVSSTRTYLTTALTATTATVVVKSTTGLTAAEAIWCDGERMHIVSVDSGTQLTVFRDSPVAHAKYAPVSDSFVATYVLSESSGTINMEGYEPERPDVRADLWDVDVGLWRSA